MSPNTDDSPDIRAVESDLADRFEWDCLPFIDAVHEALETVNPAGLSSPQRAKARRRREMHTCIDAIAGAMR